MTESAYCSNSACTQPGELNALRWDDLTPREPETDPRLELDLGLDLDMDPDSDPDWETCTMRMDSLDRGEMVYTVCAEAGATAHAMR